MVEAIVSQHPRGPISPAVPIPAPAARPPIPIEIQSAAELIGRVRMHPTETDTTMPIMKGLRVVARLMTSPKDITHSLIGAQQYLANSPPATTAIRGVMMMLSSQVEHASDLERWQDRSILRQQAPTGAAQRYP